MSNMEKNLRIIAECKIAEICTIKSANNRIFVRKHKRNMARLFAIINILLVASTLQAQIINSTWRDHMSYFGGKAVAVSNTDVYCATELNIFCYSKEDGRITHLTPIEGLSEMGIGAIAYNDKTQELIIGYISGNIDIVSDDGKVHNMPSLKNSDFTNNKKINHINIHGGTAYLSCSFGIIAIDISRREFSDTYILGSDGKHININSSVVYDGYLYALTNTGLMRGRLDNPFLTDLKNWEQVTELGQGLKFNTGCVFDNKLYVNAQIAGDTIGRVSVFDGEKWTVVWNSLPEVKTLTSRDNKLVLCDGLGVYVFDTNLNQLLFWDSELINTGIADGDVVWYAHREYGLGRTDGNDYTAYTPDGPALNRFYNVCYNAGNVLVAPGGMERTGENHYNKADIYSFDGSRWTNIDHQQYPVFNECRDIINFTTNGSKNHFIANCWRHGVLEYDNGTFTRHNAESTGGLLNDFVSYCAYDYNGNLWFAGSIADKPITVRTPSGEWYNYAYSSHMTGLHTGKLICTRNNDLWLVSHRGIGVLVWNPNGTPETNSDDDYSFFFPSDETNKKLNCNINDIVEDKNGILWLATDEGVYIYDHPERVLRDGNTQAHYPQMIVDGFYQSLLVTEVVNTIAVDGGNRKWFGTESGGIFVISPDGTEQIASYNTSNSPLFSNNVKSIAIDDDKGILYVITDKGLQSVTISTTKANSETAEITAYPNPVQSDYYGDVAIRGLLDNSVVRITDLRGNLVHETMSNGGGALWNLCNRDGRRVETGIYLIQCTTTDGVTRNVGKIHVVK